MTRLAIESQTVVDLGSLTGLTSAQIDTAYATAAGRAAANGRHGGGHGRRGHHYS